MPVQSDDCGCPDSLQAGRHGNRPQRERTSKNYAFVDAVARKNVELTVADIHKGSPVLAGMESGGTIHAGVTHARNGKGPASMAQALDVW